jgi:hypothetical protein
MFEDRNTTIETINRVDIPKMLLAKSVSLAPQRVTDFVKSRPLPEPDAARIKEAVRKIEFIYSVFAPYKILFDSPELLESAFEDAQATKRNRELASAQFELDSATSDLQKVFAQFSS